MMSLRHEKIDYFNQGEIRISGQTFNSDLIVQPSGIKSWRRSNRLSLSINDFQSIISERPAYLIIGNGLNNNLQVDNFTKSKLQDLGFEVYIAKTRTAISKYNKCCKERKTIGLFHLY